MSAICQVLSWMLFPSDQNFDLTSPCKLTLLTWRVSGPMEKKITHATQALAYVLKYSGSAKRAQPDQEWKDDVKG